MMKCILKDLIEYSKDGEWGKDQPFEESEEMLCVRGTDFESARFGSTEKVPRRFIAQRHADRKRLQPWDVLIEAAGGTKDQPTGRTVLLKPSVFRRASLPLTCASFSRLIRFRTDLCDPSFMFWYLQSLYHSDIMRAYHTQHTGVARFRWTTFAENEPLQIPDLPTQRKIAGILSAYDDLIENNMRRIKILEEMAQSLYREWFVHFRFPGHESAKFVDSELGRIPKGWEVRKILDFADVIYGFSFKANRFNSAGEGIPVVRIRNIQDGRSETYSEEEGDPKHRIKNGDILVGMDGDFHMTIWSGGAAWQNQRVAKFRPKGAMGTYLLFLTLEKPIHYFDSTITGTTVAHLGDSHIKTIEFASPPETIMRMASDLLEPMAQEQLNLRRRNQTLRRTRDLLLPKLLSGDGAFRAGNPPANLEKSPRNT